MKTLHFALLYGALLTVICFLAVISATKLFTAQQPSHELLLTTNDPYEIVYLVDVSRDIRVQLRGAAYGDLGWRWRLGNDYNFVSLCLSFDVTQRCGVSIRSIVPSQELSRVDVISELWAQNRYSVPIWSPDGRYIAFVENQFSRYIVVLLDTTDMSLFYPVPDEDGEGSVFVAWSPDSQQIVFSCHAGRNVCIFNVADHQLSEIALARVTNITRLMWSPDGRYIGFIGVNFDVFKSNLFLIAADTHMVRSIELNPPYATDLDWSSDGAELALLTRESFTTIHPETFALTHDEIDFTIIRNLDSIAWSPDGRYIAVAGIGDGYDTTLVVDMTSGQINQLALGSYSTDATNPFIGWVP